MQGKRLFSSPSIYIDPSRNNLFPTFYSAHSLFPVPFSLPSKKTFNSSISQHFKTRLQLCLPQAEPVNSTQTEDAVDVEDSREICRYVSDKYAEKGNKTLFGAGFLERPSVEQWLQAETVNFDPPSSALVFQLGFAPALRMPPDEALIRQSEEKLARVLDVYNMRLGDSAYLAGDEFTLADLSHLPNSHYLVTMSERGRKLFAGRRNVARWLKEMAERASWKRVVELQRERPGLLENSIA
ncbi:hypothetical protein Cni_G14692 [Canna indica]|uniref:glutathione transferase n=1 Tax=Canna indica TaxID=4628 RepID=A0AAQ3QAV6_9LILI|nr:hypothetical protein Cni_G14692 [Canna indica]